MPDDLTTERERLRAPQVPSHAEVGVVAMVPDEWGPLWQPRHHVVSRLTEWFPVVWMSPAPEWREAVRAGFRAPPPGNGLVPGLDIDQAGWHLPRIHHPRWAGEFMLRRRLGNAVARLRRRGCRSVVLYLWRPDFRRAAALYPWDAVVYHVDDEYSFSPVVQAPNPEEVALLTEADLVFIHSATLWDRKAPLARRAIRAPNGVDYRRFATPCPEPPELANVPRPRLGYVGWLKQQLDWPLLESLVVRHPEWSWVLLGPVKPDPGLVAIIDRIRRRPNVYLVDAKPAPDLAPYVQHLDVALLPYRRDGYTQYIYPMKLHEYLAAGLPVVGAPIPALERHRDVIWIADGVEDWSHALREALEPRARDPEAVARRRRVARDHDWDAIVALIADAVWHLGRTGKGSNR